VKVENLGVSARRKEWWVGTWLVTEAPSEANIGIHVAKMVGKGLRGRWNSHDFIHLEE